MKEQDPVSTRTQGLLDKAIVPAENPNAILPTEISPTADQDEKWWNDNMPDKEYYVIEDFVLGYRNAEDRSKPIGISEKTKISNKILTIRYQDKSIEPKRLPNNPRRFFYSKEDAKKIMATLQKNKAGSSPRTSLPGQIGTNGHQENAPQRNVGLPAEVSTKAGPNNGKETGHALDPQLEEVWAGLKADEKQKAFDNLEKTKKQLLKQATHTILSYLKEHTMLVGLQNNLSKFLTDQLDEPINLARDIFIPKDAFIPFLVKRLDAKDLGTLFGDSFTQELEELWEKNPRSAVQAKDKEIMEICQWLKNRSFHIQYIVRTVSIHFRISMPKKIPTKPA